MYFKNIIIVILLFGYFWSQSHSFKHEGKVSKDNVEDLDDELLQYYLMKLLKKSNDVYRSKQVSRHHKTHKHTKVDIDNLHIPLLERGPFGCGKTGGCGK